MRGSTATRSSWPNGAATRSRSRRPAELRQAGLDADDQVVDGDPGHEIVLLAERWAADLVVVGSHAYTAIHRLLIGSVARHVLHHAPASVLVVREGVAVVREAADAGVPAAFACLMTGRIRPARRSLVMLP